MLEDINSLVNLIKGKKELDYWTAFRLGFDIMLHLFYFVFLYCILKMRII